LLSAFLVAVSFCPPVLAQTGPALDMRLVEGAKREQKLVFYTIMDLPQIIQVVHDFVQKYPFLGIEVYPLEAETLVEKVRGEARLGAPAYDVVIGGGGLMQPLFEENLLAPYHSPQREGVSDALIDSQGYWSGCYINPFVLGYNTALVKEEEIPRSYDHLLGPRWRGRRIAIDRTAHGLLRGLGPMWGEEKAVAYLRRLAGQQPVMARTSISAVESMHIGDVSMVVARAPVLQGYKEKFGSPIDWLFLEPVIAQIDAVMLSARPSHPNAARLFADFSLSQEGQDALRGVQQIPVRRHMKVEAKTRTGQQWFLERPDRHINYPETVRAFREIFGIP
jgi:iron(III) transport system substrate-binding protein